MAESEERKADVVESTVEDARVLRTLAVRLRALRKEKGWSQEEVSRRTGVSQRSISHYESGEKEPGIVTCIRLAATFGVSLNDLIGLDSIVLDREATE